MLSKECIRLFLNNTESRAPPGRESLFSSHPETRVPIAEIQNSGCSPSVRHMCGIPPPVRRKKQEKTIRGFLLQKKNITSYGGITRIRLKGRSLITSSQPAAQAPLFLLVCVLYTLLPSIASVLHPESLPARFSLLAVSRLIALNLDQRPERPYLTDPAAIEAQIAV